jgi:hypothetical protein
MTTRNEEILIERREALIDEINRMSLKKWGTAYHVDRVAELERIARALEAR